MSRFAEPSWERHCAEPIADAIGNEIWGELGGCPRSPREAAELYRRLGVRTFREAVGKVLGPEIEPARAMRGDVVMAQNALGICRGDIAEFMDRTIPMRLVACAWRAKGRPRA